MADLPRPCLPLHLAVQLRAVRVFTSALEARPELLSHREPDGATMLHTLARCGPQLPSKASKPMEDAAMRALDRDRRLAQELLKSEDSCGLRPLEACIKFGAFRLARQLLHLPGYLMQRSWRDRGWETRRYRINEYDLLHGDRRWLSPPVLLTNICRSQMHALKASKLAKDPLMQTWYQLMKQQTCLLSVLRMLIASLPSLLFLSTIVSPEAQKLVSSFCIVVHCNRAVYSAASAAGISDSALTRNVTLYYDTLLTQQVKGMGCYNLHDSFLGNRLMVVVVLALNATSLLAKFVYLVLNRRRMRPLFEQRLETPSDCFINRTEFHAFHVTCVLSGISLTVCAQLFFGNKFWYRAFYPANNLFGLYLEQVILGSTGLFIICNLLYFGQYLEIMSKSIGKLFFTFQRMNTSSRLTMPLLFYWLVMFSLVFYSVVNTDDFVSNTISLYSTVKTALNTVNFPTDNTAAVIFHILFFVFVGLNLLNFLIAYVNETFLECNADFELAYWLLRLHGFASTFGYFEWLLRLPHCLEGRCKKACVGTKPIDISQPFFKRFNYMDA